MITELFNMIISLEMKALAFLYIHSAMLVNTLQVLHKYNKKTLKPTITLRPNNYL